LATITSGGNSNLVLQFQANPTVYGDTMMANRDSFMGVSNAVSAQMAAFRGAPGSVGTQGVSAPNGMSVWFSGSGQYRRTSAGSSAPGFTSTGGGVVLGLDQMVSPRTHAGLVVAASGLSINGGQGMSYSGQSVQLRAYATTQRGPAFVEGQVGILAEQGTVKRSIYGSGIARGTTNGAELGGTVRTGLRYSVSNWNIEPSVTLGAMTLTQNPLTEGGAGGSNLSIDRAGYLNSLYTVAGVQVDRSFTLGNGWVLTALGRAGWLRESGATSARLSASVGTSSSSFSSAPIRRDAADLGLQAELRPSANLALVARYETLTDGRNNSQTIRGGVSYTNPPRH
jgi:subtilase-type serine protease